MGICDIGFVMCEVEEFWVEICDVLGYEIFVFGVVWLDRGIIWMIEGIDILMVFGYDWLFWVIFV